MRAFFYFKPRSLDEVWKIKNRIPDARFIAGGTDLMVQIKNKTVHPPALISLKSIPELSGVELNNGAYIGAMTTISDLIHHSSLVKEFPIIAEAAKRLGSVQIRNTATIGGNLCNCSPCADMATPLLVLDAKVHIQSAMSSREIPLAEFFVGPGKSCLAPDEILTEIKIDPYPQNTRTVFFKKGRVKMDLAVASMAALLVFKDSVCTKARLAAGSVAPVPLRLKQAEALLEGSKISGEIIKKAREIVENSISPISDVRSTAEYRRHISGVYVKQALENGKSGDPE